MQQKHKGKPAKKKKEVKDTGLIRLTDDDYMCLMNRMEEIVDVARKKYENQNTDFFTVVTDLLQTLCIVFKEVVRSNQSRGDGRRNQPIRSMTK